MGSFAALTSRSALDSVVCPWLSTLVETRTMLRRTEVAPFLEYDGGTGGVLQVIVLSWGGWRSWGSPLGCCHKCQNRGAAPLVVLQAQSRK